MDHRGEYAQADRDPPDKVVVALDVVEPPGAPAAEEAAELWLKNTMPHSIDMWIGPKM
jgi:hypothetical protein